MFTNLQFNIKIQASLSFIYKCNTSFNEELLMSQEFQLSLFLFQVCKYDLQCQEMVWTKTVGYDRQQRALTLNTVNTEL